MPRLFFFRRISCLRGRGGRDSLAAHEKAKSLLSFCHRLRFRVVVFRRCIVRRWIARAGAECAAGDGSGAAGRGRNDGRGYSENNGGGQYVHCYEGLEAEGE